MNKLFLLVLSALAIIGCSKAPANRAEAIASEIHNPESKYVVVAVHRGDWRNYPENSIPAIESVIKMGADIVEIDIHMSADSVLVVCHDSDVRRTTNFSSVYKANKEKSAKISDLTLEEIKGLKLKRGHGVATDSLRMPTLEEALLCAKDRICVNIDKGYDYYEAVMELAQKLGVTNQILIKGSKPIEDVARRQANYENNIMYMPVVNIQKESGKALFNSYQEKGIVPLAYEVCWGKGGDELFRETAGTIISQGAKLWVNTIWASLCGGPGNDDDAAFECKDPGEVYQQYIDAGVTMIQTDRPQLLIGWLAKKGHHSLK